MELVRSAGVDVDDDAVRQIPDWILFHPHPRVAASEWVQAAADADEAESAGMLRAAQMLAMCRPGTDGAERLSSKNRCALAAVEPAISATVPYLLQRSSNKGPREGDARQHQGLGRSRAAGVASHFAHWVNEKIPESPLARAMKFRPLRDQSPNTRLFMMAVAESVALDVVIHLFRTLVREDPCVAAAAYVSAAMGREPVVAVTLLRLFRWEWCVSLSPVELPGHGRVLSAMRACMPFLVSTASGSADCVTGKVVPPCEGVQSVLSQLGEWSALDAEMYAVWRDADAPWVGEMPYHPAMCG